MNLEQQAFSNGLAADWARQMLSEPLEIKLLFSSPWSRALLYFLLFGLLPLFLIFLKLSGRAPVGWSMLFVCSGVTMLPAFVILFVGILARQRFVKTLDREGVVSGRQRKYLWRNLYYVDHVSRYRRHRKIRDNQLHLVFADGLAIIPPLIHNRDEVWRLINSIPAEVRFDGKATSRQ